MAPKRRGRRRALLGRQLQWFFIIRPLSLFSLPQFAVRCPARITLHRGCAFRGTQRLLARRRCFFALYPWIK